MLPVLAVSPAAAAAVAAALLAAAAAARLLLRFAAGVLRHRALRLPAPPEPDLLLGHARVLFSDTSPLRMAEYVTALGALFKLRVLGATMVVLADPAAIAKLNRWAAVRGRRPFGGEGGRQVQRRGGCCHLRAGAGR
jgi:hypothetical protein